MILPERSRPSSRTSWAFSSATLKACRKPPWLRWKVALEGLDVWIVDALRYMPHPSHSDLAQTLD